MTGMAEICPLHIVVASFAGWMNRRQGEVLDDLIEEKRVLKSQLKGRRPRLYVKAKVEPSWRFWGLYVHVGKESTLREAYRLAEPNNGAPGTEGVTFEAIEGEGVGLFLGRLREELLTRTYRPERARKVGIPKSGGKTRVLSIPTIRDRLVQGALKLILEPIFEADFQPGSFGYPGSGSRVPCDRARQDLCDRPRPTRLLRHSAS
jgi:RNA-directed DNA polymerase